MGECRGGEGRGAEGEVRREERSEEEGERKRGVCCAVRSVLLLLQVWKSLEAGQWLEEDPYEMREAYPVAYVSCTKRLNDLYSVVCLQVTCLCPPLCLCVVCVTCGVCV